MGEHRFDRESLFVATVRAFLTGVEARDPA